jgi:hypothetical protein
MGQPHPGCIAFYRRNSDPAKIGQSDMLRGYKVYRNTGEQGDTAPWLFKNQGVYENGKILPGQQKMNKTCDLLKAGATGRLRISFRALSARELALLLQVCQIDWRLGGGKPLGLGHCAVRLLRMLDESGQEVPVPPEWKKEVEDIQDRVAAYLASQVPVPKLRYPRAAQLNRNQVTRGGHVWFVRHAAPTKNNRGEVSAGLQVLRAYDDLSETTRTSEIPAQVLPEFNPADPLADTLYAYDAIALETRRVGNNQNEIGALETFDEKKQYMENPTPGANQGMNREHRKNERKGRE